MSVSKKRGRPSKYTEAVAAEICSRLAGGESLNAICQDARMPADTTVLNWSLEDCDARPEFCEKYARARQRGYERMAEELITISDANYTGPNGLVDNAAVQQARLKSDNRKWLLSKMLPKQFGDRVTQEITGGDAPLIQRIELIPISPAPRSETTDETVHIGEAAITPLRALSRP
jgi:hypothetical protein